MIRAVAIVVPAANEQACIGPCLDAIAAARAHAHRHLDRPVEVRTVVVLDSCVDATAAEVRSRPSVRTVVCAASRVGTARALGVRQALASASAGLSETWIANTDADSLVPVDWITRMVVEAERGAHLVLGTVLPAAGIGQHGRRRWLDRHLLREGHPHVHGANFGIRADVYQALGGWPALAVGEDMALAARARATGHLRTVRIATIPVVTSSRLVGRTPEGFAGYLRSLAGAVPAVGSTVVR